MTTGRRGAKSAVVDFDAPRWFTGSEFFRTPFPHFAGGRIPRSDRV